jgi:hypothetical protein
MPGPPGRCGTSRYRRLRRRRVDCEHGAGRALRGLLPSDAVPKVPELFYVECGAVLRRWDLNVILTPAQMAGALDQLMAWPLRVTRSGVCSTTFGGSERT